MTFFLPPSPGVYVQETDLTTRAELVTQTIGAAVFESARGTLAENFTTSRPEVLEVYGKPDPAYGNGLDCLMAFMSESSGCWTRRVVGDGWLHSGTAYHNDDETSPKRTLRRDFPTGTVNGFAAQQAPMWQTINFSAALVTGDTFRAVLTDNEAAPQTITVTYASASNTTLANIASSLATAITAIAGAGGVAEVLDESVSGVGDDRIIRWHAPVGKTLMLTQDGSTPLLAHSGAGTATVSINSQVHLFNVYAENPGAWGNDLGVRIRKIDQGIKQRVRLTFSKAFAATHTFTCAINGSALSAPIAFSTSNDATLTAIKNALQTKLDAVFGDFVAGTAKAEIVSKPFGTDNDREIILTAPVDGPDLITVTGVTMAGTSPPACTVAEILKGVARDGTFTLQVFERTNALTPAEEYVVSLGYQRDGLGQQLNIVEVINNGPNRSSRIRVDQPAWSRSMKMVGTVVTNADTTTEELMDVTVNWLSGGEDGGRATGSQLRAGWGAFSSREKYPVRVLINCGYTATDVQQYLVALAETRRDCFAVLDMPASEQSTERAFNYRRNVLNVDSSYAAIYTPDLKIVDEFTDIVRFVPPSGHVAAAYARTDRMRAVWFAPAGLNRGLVKQVMDLRVRYEQGDRDLLDPAQVNCIIIKPGKGPVIWGAETLQSRASVLRNVSVRRLLIALEVAMVDALDYSVFEPNDPILGFQITQMLTSFLQPVKEGRGLENFLVVSDDSNNGAATREQGIRNVDVYLTCVVPAKRIRLQTVLTRQGANFSELVATGGNF